jgi:hypothetical protein
MAQRRRGHKADVVAAAARVARGLEVEGTVTTSRLAKNLHKPNRPSTGAMHAQELVKFRGFVEDHLQSAQEGREVWNAWAGAGATVDDILREGKYALYLADDRWTRSH